VGDAEHGRRRPLLIVVAVAAIVVLLARRIATFATDALWYASAGFGDVFWSLFATKVGLGFVAGLVLTALVGGNLLLARRLRPTYRAPSEGEVAIERYREAIEPHARGVSWLLAVGVGLLGGLWTVLQWQAYVLWAHATEFGRVDPHFGRDLGWFVFVLPFHSAVSAFVFSALAVTLGLAALAHYVFGGIRPQAPSRRLTPEANLHLSVLLAALIAVQAWRFWLDQYLLSFSERGSVTGLSYTDVNAQLPALRLLVVIAAVCVVLFLANIRFRGWLLPSAGVGILLVAAVVLSGVFPAVIQRVQVEPQELAREEPYIERNLELTRFGFDLADVDVEAFPAQASLTDAQVRDNAETLNSVRLWDPVTLQSVYRQLQLFRPYYEFRDVDVDRYRVDDEVEQVLLSVRELNERELPAPTWQNLRLFFTHGFGHVASPTSGATDEGQPRFLVGDIPPGGAPRLEIDNPRVYFGENPPAYSIVGTDLDEFDFPLEGDDATFRYDGDAGVPVGSLLRRLAFALRFTEPNFVLSRLLGDDSRVLLRREVKERVGAVAPYLKLDHDPYAVIANGRISWIVDAYTASDMLPYSQRVQLGPLTLADQLRFVAESNANGQLEFVEKVVAVPGIEGRANYLRNSVKAVVDAYDGTITLYAVDPDDPVLVAWQRAFPGTFTPLEQAPDELREHFRYPEDLFRVQAALYRQYHIPAPAAFYSKEDVWEIPRDAAAIQNTDRITPRDRERLRLRPYYLLLQLPGEAEEEFALIQPYAPQGRQNLTAWLAGRSDGEHYGELKSFVMPPNRTVLGPEQVQALIQEDDAVAEQTTLWSQAGSDVIYGNLLVIPVEDSLLYVQPLFLRSTQSEIPLLQRVVMVFGGTVVMENTLADALAALFGPAAPGVEELGDGAIEGPRQPDGERPGDPEVARLIRDALGHFAEAEEALRAGDLGRYQTETRAAQDLLERAEARTR
jgi:uncharacterized membrane protein (UPF0182 family)